MSNRLAGLALAAFIFFTSVNVIHGQDSSSVTGLVQDNRAQLSPALSQLHQVLTTLQQQETALTKGVQTLAPFTRVFANALGNGPWFDACVPNLVVPSVTPGLPSVGCPGGGAR